jgi:hypothetical protein
LAIFMKNCQTINDVVKEVALALGNEWICFDCYTTGKEDIKNTVGKLVL